MTLPEYFVRYPDPERKQMAAAARGVSEDEVAEEEGWGYAEFEHQADAHDFADRHDGFVFARRDIRLLADTHHGRAWGYTPVYLPNRPDASDPEKD